ncbi:hypothetical protein J3R30DRAFT_583409 [Lentinula aciculospora]|uniref:Uncharacterized protein n=1 Tax=Lentinula aciculospora TaxID=153920 RepID=A0A9W9A6K9_9AGAR|nr:hypothetical protein J3R30DRAFT_583409 [Lentinula aciculospora]
MGPADMSTINIKPRIPHLNVDLSNWVVYKQRIITELFSYGLGRYLHGLVWEMPKVIVRRDDKFYLGDSTLALNRDKFTKHLEERDTYDTKEAQVRKIIFKSIPVSLYLHVKDEPTAHATWKLLCSTVEVKSHLGIVSLNNCMMNLQTPEDGNIRETLSQLQVWYEELAGMGFKAPKDSYMTYIRQTCGPPYHDLFKSINITAKLTGVALMSAFLISSARLAATE